MIVSFRMFSTRADSGTGIGLKASFYRLIKAGPLCFDGYKVVHGLLLLNIHESVIISKDTYSFKLTTAKGFNHLYSLTKRASNSKTEEIDVLQNYLWEQSYTIDMDNFVGILHEGWLIS